MRQICQLVLGETKIIMYVIQDHLATILQQRGSQNSSIHKRLRLSEIKIAKKAPPGQSHDSANRPVCTGRGEDLEGSSLMEKQVPRFNLIAMTLLQKCNCRISQEFPEQPKLPLPSFRVAVAKGSGIPSGGNERPWATKKGILVLSDRPLRRALTAHVGIKSGLDLRPTGLKPADSSSIPLNDIRSIAGRRRLWRDSGTWLPLDRNLTGALVKVAGTIRVDRPDSFQESPAARFRFATVWGSYPVGRTHQTLCSWDWRPWGSASRSHREGV